MQPILSGHALWSFQSEVTERKIHTNLRAGVAGVLPFHSHEGNILLYRDYLALTDSEHLDIRLTAIVNVFFGFDEVFQQSFGKNLGLAWQPLRVRFNQHEQVESVYLLIDTNMVGTQNQQWFQSIKELLSG